MALVARVCFCPKAGQKRKIPLAPASAESGPCRFPFLLPFADSHVLAVYGVSWQLGAIRSLSGEQCPCGKSSQTGQFLRSPSVTVPQSEESLSCTDQVSWGHLLPFHLFSSFQSEPLFTCWAPSREQASSVLCIRVTVAWSSATLIHWFY